MHRHITARIVWRDQPDNIQCQVHRGAVLRLEQTSEHITFLEVSLDEDQREDSVVFVTSSLRNFSFFPANVKPGWPMIVPTWGVAVTDAQDPRDYDQLLSDMQSLQLPKSQDQWRNTPETTFAEAAAATKELRCLSFLGVTRDMRTFDIGFRMDVKETDLHSWIRPTMAGSPIVREKQTVKYEYSVGRAPSCKNTVRRRCEEGYLPIVNAVYTDEGVDYHMQLFCSMGKTPLTRETLAGTNCYIAYTNAPISNPVPNQALMEPYNPQEETVIYLEDRQDLRLLSGIPRWYMKKGLRIQGAASHFGKLDFSVSPDSPQVRAVTVSLALHNHENAGPENVYLRLPYPEKQPILSTELGEILSDGETLRIPASALASPATWLVRYQA